MPVIYADWDEWRSDVRARASEPPMPLLATDTVFCADCWGQRVIVVRDPESGLYGQARCGTCGGSGAVRR